MIYYLPVLISTFISLVGMQWETNTSAATANNIWTIFMLQSWLLMPPLLLFVIYRNRHDIGKLREGADNKKVKSRDPSKIQWKQDWSTFEQVMEVGLNPEGLIALCNKKIKAKNRAKAVKLKFERYLE